MAIVYFDPARPVETQPRFRRGEAAIVDFTLDESAQEKLARVAIPANAVHGLIGLGVVARLNRLPLEVGPIAAGRDAVLFPGALERAIEILYAVENELWNGSRDYRALEVLVATEPRDAGSATQLAKKISANDSPTSAWMPQRCSACGACSRELPQPKFLFTTRIDAPRKRRSSKGWPFGSPSELKRTSRKTNSSSPAKRIEVM